MKSKVLFAAGVITAAAMLISVLVISIEKREPTIEVGNPRFDVADLVPPVDTITEQPEAEVFTDTQIVPEFVGPSIDYDTITVDYSRVNCTAVMNGLAIAGTEGGVFVYDPVDKSTELISVHNGLTEYNVLSLLPDDSCLYIGTTSGLFVRDELGLVARLAPELDAEITAIAKSGDDLYLGTHEDGLIKLTGDETTVMMHKSCVTDIVFGDDVLWVAADGHGLFCRDSVGFKRRYLEDDSTAFDHVSSLGYKFNRLFVGTPQGMYVYDGGRWNLYDGDDGLLVCDVTDISFHGWKTLVGTRDWGYYEVFEGWVTPICWSEGLEVTSIASDKSMVVLGTPEDGIFLSVSKKMRNVNPEQEFYEIPVYAALFF